MHYHPVICPYSTRHTEEAFDILILVHPPTRAASLGLDHLLPVALELVEDAAVDDEQGSEIRAVQEMVEAVTLRSMRVRKRICGRKDSQR